MPALSRFKHGATRLAAVCAVALLGQLAAVHPALAWWNGDWNYRVQVTADTTAKGANVSAPIGHMQVLLRLHSGNFNFSTVKEDGSDIRVVAGDDRTPLKFSFEKFDPLVAQEALIWVDVPSLDPNAATNFYIYWGDKNAVNGSDSRSTFAGDDLIVYHFDEDNGVPRDSTAYGNNAQTGGKRVDGGMVDSGLHLDGKSFVHIPTNPSLSIASGQPLTLSLWIHPDDATTSGVLYDQKAGGNEVLIGIENKVPYISVTTPSGTQRSAAGAALTAGFHLIDVTSSDRVALYVDGALNTQLAGALPLLSGPATLGGMDAPAAPAAPPADQSQPAPDATQPAAPAAPPNFIGTIDEFRMIKAVEPAGVMLTRVASEGPSPKLISLAQPEQSSIFGSGTFGIILRSVTPDAWFVIFILIVMSLISWAVMIGKGIYITRVMSANKSFRNAYRGRVLDAQGDVLAVIREMHHQEHAKWRGSSLFRLNEVAAIEIEERLQHGHVDQHGTMPARSITAIRSALEGRQVLENQRLHRLMVLLTIAIAGGPFIGLLGTVIGVMITFASIAAAGDVNINAIAPGISAALLATVAGLAVAIPALFGYNYLGTRITDAISDMTVHIDNLCTKMGEGLYGKHHQAAGE